MHLKISSAKWRPFCRGEMSWHFRAMLNPRAGLPERHTQWTTRSCIWGHSGYELSQWQTTLRCNVVCHWLSPYPKWSLCVYLIYSRPDREYWPLHHTLVNYLVTKSVFSLSLPKNSVTPSTCNCAQNSLIWGTESSFLWNWPRNEPHVWPNLPVNQSFNKLTHTWLLIPYGRFLEFVQNLNWIPRYTFFLCENRWNLETKQMFTVTKLVIVYWLTLGHRPLQAIFHMNIIDIDNRKLN